MSGTPATPAYRPGREIARGGMGAVLDARDQKLGRSVAMKVMLRRHAGQEEQQRFLREARVLGQLAHPNIVPVHDVGTDPQGRLFYTMKLVQGVTLLALLETLKAGDKETLARYPLNTLLTVFQKVCDAMAFAHSRGVIHRDLKPENIMVGEFGEVLVMDWGLAKILPGSPVALEASGALPLRGQLGQTGPEGTVLINPTGGDEALDADEAATEETMLAGSTPRPGSAAKRELRAGTPEPARAPVAASDELATMEGAVMGTPRYMSPEQAQGHISELDARSDIFTLGGILYALLTLRPPVEGESLDSILTKVKRGDITPPSAFNAGSATQPAHHKPSGEAVSPKKIVPLPHLPGGQVPGALSAVAMKALSVEREQRYQTVAALAADITAYQGGFATSAENASALTLLRLFIHRHKVLAAAASLIVLLTLGFLFKVNAEKQAAQESATRATKAEQVAESNEAKSIAAADRATRAEAVAVREKETARQALAKSQLDLAEKEFERGKFVEAQKILEETPESFRDANWRFLRAHSRDFTAQLSIRGMGTAHRLLFLPQGDRFAARFAHDVIGVFTLAGRQIGDWVPVTGKDFSGAFGIDRDGGRIAFPASANEVTVQEVATGKLVRRWTCELDQITDVLISPDGRTVLAAGGNQLIAYHTQTGAPLWTQPFIGVVPTFSPDGGTVAVLAARDGLNLKIQLLDTGTSAVRGRLEATADKLDKRALQFNQAGDRLACLSGDEVILWNPRTSAKIRALHFQGEAVKLLNPGGEAVATSSGGRVRLWDTATGRLLRSFSGAGTDVRTFAFSPDGKMLLSSQVSANDGIVLVWLTRLGEEIASTRPQGFRGYRVAFDRDGSRFYASGQNAAGWESRSGVEKWKFAKENLSLVDLAVHPTDGSIIMSGMNEPPFMRKSADGESLQAFGTNANSSLKFNRSGQLLLTVDYAFRQTDPGRGFNVLEYPSGKLLRKIPFNEASLQPFAAFCLDDAAIATAALAGGITVWDWKAGTPLRQIAPAQTGSIACLASSPDGAHLATGGPDRWVRVWETATGRLEAAFRAHWEGVRCVKFSPDGAILSGSEDGAVRLHDAATGEERLAFYGHTTPVVDVDISSDGALIAAITSDGYTKVWDRKLSSEAAQLGKQPAASKPAVATDADGWEDVFARLTPEGVGKTGHGWSLKNGELFGPDTKYATLPLPCELSGANYRLRVKLRQLPANNCLHVVLPVADRMCGFELEERPTGTITTGLVLVNGKWGKNLSGVTPGKQVKDSKPHDLEVTVRLNGVNATVTTTLDTRPLYEWTGPIAALSQMKNWANTEPGDLALGTYAGGWAVSEVKVKRL